MMSLAHLAYRAPRSSMLLGAALLCAEHAFAQSARSDIESPSVIQEVVVRGAPLNDVREVNLGGFGERDVMSVPLSVQSFSAKDIEQASARTLLDVLQADASVQAASVGGAYDNFRLRGFAVDFTNTLRRDGLSLAPFQDVAHENVERIDLLKGPSGFLYGLNSPGGTINYIVERPTRDPLLNVTAETTTLSGRYVSVDGSRSTDGGAFGVRVNAAHEKNGDFNHAGDLERIFASLAADVRLTDTALFQLNTDIQETSKVADPLLRAGQSEREDPTDPASYILPPRIDRRDLLAPSWFRYETQVYNVDAKLNVEFGDAWFAVAQAGYSRNRRDEAFQDLFDIRPNGDIATADIYLSPDARPTVGSLQLYAGGEAQTGSLLHDLFFGAAIKQFDHPQNTSTILDLSVGNVHNPVDPPPVDFGPNVYAFKSVVDEASLFVSDLLTLSDHWQVLLGGRYISYESFSKDAARVVYNKQREQVFAPSLGLIFTPAPNIIAYANHLRGVEQGEFGPFFANNASEQTAPIRAKQYEIGMKLAVAPRVDLQLALFQIERQAAYVNLSNDFVADGVQRHRGAEAFAGAGLGSVRMTGNVSYLSTRLLDVAEPATRNKRTEGVPEWSGGVSLDWSVPFIGGLELGCSVNFASSRPIDAQNTGFIDGYEVVNASVRYAAQVGSRTVALRLNALNLLDRYYYASAFYQGGLNVGRPREIILSVSADF